jgi:catechol 2,3-dioxygenase
MRRVLSDALRMGEVGLSVRDLERALAFYDCGLVLETVTREPGRAVLGAGGRPLLELVERRGGRRDPAEAGLFHVAFLLPDRPALGRALRLLRERRIPLTGAADHTVSEALYLDDPDGHGIEIYADRPREAWYRGVEFLLTNRRLDMEGVLAEAERPAGLVAGTVVGHVHLETHDLAATRAFYLDRLGLDLMMDWNQALFMARGGYHHHLAANIWNGRSRPAGDGAERIGLLYYTMVLGSAEALETAAALLPEAVREGSALHLTDPSGLQLRLVE